MILPISALARSSCNSKNILKQQDRAARRLSGPVFLRREIRKNDLSSASSPSQSCIDRQIIPTFWLCHFPPTGGNLPKAEPLEKLGALPYCQSLLLWERWHCGAMTERARPLTIKFYPDQTQSWFRPRPQTAIRSLSKVILLKIWRTCLFFAEIFLSNGNCKTIGQGFIL